MITCYAIVNFEGRYLCEDEDSIGGTDYTSEIDDFTLLFSEEEVAQRESCGDNVVELQLTQSQVIERKLQII